MRIKHLYHLENKFTLHHINDLREDLHVHGLCGGSSINQVKAYRSINSNFEQLPQGNIVTTPHRLIYNEHV